jgi:hypothetical protein
MTVAAQQSSAMRRIGVRAGAAGLSAVLAIGLAACGGSGGSGGPAPSPSRTGSRIVGPTAGGINPNTDTVTLLQASYNALLAAPSFQYDSKTTSDTDGTTAETLISLDSSGNATGRVTASGATVLLRVKDGTLYLQAPQTFFSQYLSVPDAKLPQTAGKWVSAAATDTAVSGLQQYDTITGLASGLFGNIPNTGLNKTPATTYNDKKVVGIYDQSGNFLYVALDGQPYPLSYQSDPSQGGGSGPSATVDLTKFGDPVSVDAPAADQVVTLASLLAS